MDIQTEKKLEAVLSLLADGNPAEANSMLNEMVQYDFDP